MVMEELHAADGTALHVACERSFPAGGGATLAPFNSERPLSSLKEASAKRFVSLGGSKSSPLLSTSDDLE